MEKKEEMNDRQPRGQFNNAHQRGNSKNRVRGESSNRARNENSIDLGLGPVLCEDHKKFEDEDYEAERYCLKCKIPVCSSCIVDHHTTHVDQAKMKIDDYLILQKKELDSLNVLLFTSSNKQELYENLRKDLEGQGRELSMHLDKRRDEIEKIKSQLDNILVLENRIVQEIREKCEMDFSNLYENRVKNYIDKCTAVTGEIIELKEEWQKSSKQGKADIIKLNKIVIYKQEANSKKNSMIMECDLMKGKIGSMLESVLKIREKIKRNSNLVQTNTQVGLISNSLKENLENFKKYDISAFSQQNVQLENFQNNNNFYNNDNYRKDNIPDSNIFENLRDKNPKEGNKITKDSDSKPDSKNEYFPPGGSGITFGDDTKENIIPLIPESDISAVKSGFIESNPLTNEFFIGIKPGFKNIKVFDPKAKRIFNYELNISMFQDGNSIIEEFLNNSRYVNLGFSCLITGGLANSQPSQLCYLLLISRKSPYKEYSEKALDISILAYAQMKESRERHCIVNLPDRKSVIVCSGFQKNSVEITNINMGSWRQLDSIREIRANATGAYVNNKYVYIFGGFKLENNKGVYLNSCEVLDISDNSNKWKFIDFEGKFVNSIKLTAAGVMNYAPGKILICGGYNGIVYLKEIYCIEYKDSDIEVFEKTRLNLADEQIFFHNSFGRCEGCTVNFDYKMDFTIFNPVTREFMISK